LRRQLPKKLIYLELFGSLLEADGGSARTDFHLRRDFPWIFEEGWTIEQWGLRRPRSTSTGAEPWADGSGRFKGPTFPFPAFPRVFLPLVVWATQFVRILLHPRDGVFVAYSPLIGTGAAAVRFFRRRSPALVVRLIGDPSAMALQLYRKRLEPLVLQRLERLVLRRADLVLPMGPFTHELARRAGAPEERIVELPHPTRWLGTEASPVSGNGRPRIVGAGRLIVQKGFDLLVLAFAEIADEFPDVQLEFAGEGPQRAVLERLAGDLGLRDRVRFRGWIPGSLMGDFFAGARVAVLPSRVNEGLGMVLVEAGVEGCPLVGTDLGGIRDIIRPGRTGILVPSNDASALADALRSLLADPELARRLGEGARAEALAYIERRESAVLEVRRRVEAIRSGA
jgi:glycosyltransferase involved in cell wall biosynthesis